MVRRYVSIQKLSTALLKQFSIYREEILLSMENLLVLKVINIYRHSYINSCMPVGPDLQLFFHIPPFKLRSRLWSSQLFNHNEAAIELQI